ncbi:hypothetical protein BS47DRAFT_830752 [Hydnum rufescens UP504]|uniref:Uncharacterized protein n=1 Tax=Hydnum rufescens UP504 TaxID=1448309 RepID=A0A9P6AZN2_9AGAM|nr:hypothetical protein BS47DRAFT_830752 [Hydnum rufescens UP504]
MSPSFLAYASDVIRKALTERGLITKGENARRCTMFWFVVVKAEDNDPDDDSERNPTLVCWRINAVVAWQQVDRRIIARGAPASYQSHSNVLGAEETNIDQRFFSEISCRAIRLTPNDEFMAFAGWVGRAPPNKNKGHQADFDTEWSWDTAEDGL